MSRTIPDLWNRAARPGEDQPLYLVEEDERWRPVSREEAAARIEELAAGLLALGLRKGDAFAILGTTRIEWALLDFALAAVGVVSAGIYPNSSADDCAYVIDHSESLGIAVEDADQLAKVESVRARLPRLRHVLTFGDLDGLAQSGRELLAGNPGAVRDAAAGIDEDDLFTLIYTSGTTGPPKGCMIRHRNYYEMVGTIDGLDAFMSAEDLMLLYLPLAHNFGRLMHLAAPYVGFTLAFCPNPLRAAAVLPAVRPTIFPSVPRVYEKIYAAVAGGLADATGARRRIADWALELGREVSRRRLAGESLPRSLALRHRIADRLVYSKIKARLGGRLRFGISGGAPLAREIAEFFHALDILVLEGYGLTECTTACTVNRTNRYRFGTVGPPLPGFELRIAGDGEIEIRSETVFAGYYKDEAASRETMTADGWLRSGDTGELDEDGFLRVTDRKKDILVTAGGKNVAPQNLENDLKASPFVSQALVVGDRRPYVTALIAVDPTEISKWQERGGGTAEQLVQEAVDQVNERRSPFEQIKRFAILPREFSLEEGEMTPTLKLRRSVCEQHFADVIERLYSG